MALFSGAAFVMVAAIIRAVTILSVSPPRRREMGKMDQIKQGIRGKFRASSVHKANPGSNFLLLSLLVWA